MFSLLKKRESDKDVTRNRIHNAYLNNIKKKAIFMGECICVNSHVFFYSTSIFNILDFFRSIQHNKTKYALTHEYVKIRFSYKLHIIFEESCSYKSYDLTDMFLVGFERLFQFLNNRENWNNNKKMPILSQDYSYFRRETGLLIDRATDFESNIKAQFITIYFTNNDKIVFERESSEHIHGMFHYGQWINKNQKSSHSKMWGLILEKNKTFQVY